MKSVSMLTASLPKTEVMLTAKTSCLSNNLRQCRMSNAVLQLTIVTNRKSTVTVSAVQKLFSDVNCMYLTVVVQIIVASVKTTKMHLLIIKSLF